MIEEIKPAARTISCH